MAYEAFDPEIPHIIGNVMDEGLATSKVQSLERGTPMPYAPCLLHTFSLLARQGERNPQRLIDGALMQLTL